MGARRPGRHRARSVIVRRVVFVLAFLVLAVFLAIVQRPMPLSGR